MFSLHESVKKRKLMRRRRVETGRRLALEPLEGRQLLATFVVDTTADAGDGSLRQAILDANATVGADTIEFEIPGSVPHSIAPTSALPEVTDAVTIDGTTQPRFAGSPVIEVRGDSAGSAGGLTLTGSNITVKGLVINRFSDYGLFIGGSNNVVAGNYIGTDTSGTSPQGNLGPGISVNGTDHLIGGSTPEARNVISANRSVGIFMGGASTRIQIAGNYIGTDVKGTTSLGTQNEGVFLLGAGKNVVGSDGDGAGDAGEGNLISGNLVRGVRLQSPDNIVAGNIIGLDESGTAVIAGHIQEGVLVVGTEGNRIGTDGDGTSDLHERNVISRNGIGIDLTPGSHNNIVAGNYIGTDLTGMLRLGNDSSGVRIVDANNNRIGGESVVQGNTIAFNTGRNDQGGVVVTGSAAGNTIRLNSIHDHGGLGIDIGPTGVTLNDPLDADIGANDLQNFPMLALVEPGASTRVAGSLNSMPGTEFIIDFYANTRADPSGFGEGQRHLGSRSVITDAAGNASFDVFLFAATVGGESITSTATNTAGSTSEFSAAMELEDPELCGTVTLTVDNTTIPEDGGVATFTATLSAACDLPVTVELGSTGTAVPGLDYEASTTQIVIPAGATSGSVTVTGAADTLCEPHETVTVDIIAVTHATELGMQQQTTTILDNDCFSSFIVTSFRPTSTGFIAEFNADLDTGDLNVFDAPSFGWGPADIVLQGVIGGIVSGSFVVDPSLRTVTFIKTGDPLTPDSYTLTLRSAINGFKDTGGRLLDGNRDGTSGDPFTTSFTIGVPLSNTVTIGIPDFVRGPGQAVNLPADSNLGIPLSISDGTGVRAIDVRIRYDPVLLEITGATVGNSMPPGAAVVLNNATPGLAILTLFSPTDLRAGSSTFVNLLAQVPTNNANAIYCRTHILDIHAVTVSDGNDNQLPVIDDDALHVVGYLGDVSFNGRINATDASQVARVAALIDPGFESAPLVDPTVLGDVSGNGRINAADASLVAQFGALIPVPQIPPIPPGVVTGPVGNHALSSINNPNQPQASDRGKLPAPTEVAKQDYFADHGDRDSAFMKFLDEDFAMSLRDLASDVAGVYELDPNELAPAPRQLRDCLSAISPD